MAKQVIYALTDEDFPVHFWKNIPVDIEPQRLRDIVEAILDLCPRVAKMYIVEESATFIDGWREARKGGFDDRICFRLDLERDGRPIRI